MTAMTNVDDAVRRLGELMLGLPAPDGTRLAYILPPIVETRLKNVQRRLEGYCFGTTATPVRDVRVLVSTREDIVAHLHCCVPQHIGSTLVDALNATILALLELGPQAGLARLPEAFAQCKRLPSTSHWCKAKLAGTDSDGATYAIGACRTRDGADERALLGDLHDLICM